MGAYFVYRCTGCNHKKDIQIKVKGTNKDGLITSMSTYSCNNCGKVQVLDDFDRNKVCSSCSSKNVTIDLKTKNQPCPVCKKGVFKLVEISEE